MLLNLTDLSAEPLQGQIVRQIRAKILAGELPAGADLPSIRLLARDHRVSVITVQRAYETLLREGLIHSRRGKGFFVSEIPAERKENMAKQRLIDQLKPVIEVALAEGLSQDDVLQIVEFVLEENGKS